MRKLLYRLAIVSMFVIGLSLAVAVGMYGVAADAAVPEPDMSAYPAAGCTSMGTFPVPRFKVQVPAPPGFVFCHVFVVDPGGNWQFSEDGCKLDGFGRRRCVEGIGTNHLWVLTDDTFLLKTISPFVWAPHWLPVVQNGYPGW